MTNCIGSSSELMVVGGSYPEYTHYYDFYKNTLSEWLQVEITSLVPHHSLSEDPISISDNLSMGVISALSEDPISISDNLDIQYSEDTPGEYLDTAATPTETLVEEVISPIENIVLETANTPSATLTAENIASVDGNTTDSTDSPTDTLTIETI